MITIVIKYKDPSIIYLLKAHSLTLEVFDMTTINWVNWTVKEVNDEIRSELERLQNEGIIEKWVVDDTSNESLKLC